MKTGTARRLSCLLPACVLIPLLLSGCAPQKAERTIFAMDTVMDLTVYGKNAEEDVAAVAERINELEKLLSVTREGSEVWALSHAGGERVRISPETNALLRAARAVGDATGGALDVTLYPVVKAWGFTTGDYQVPDDGTIEELLERVDYRAIRVEPDETGPADAVLPAGMELDFGALAKGYAGELCAGMLRGAGAESALLQLGGNIQTVGCKPDGSPWTVEVQDPAGESGQALGAVELTDQAAVTSGGYQRYFEEDGARYWHILDPKTGAPARSGLTSVTVIGDSGTLCDALSTACFVLGRDAALELWRTYGETGLWPTYETMGMADGGGFDLILVGEDGTVTVTGGLRDSFRLYEDRGYALDMVER